jgi:hypothetical protein
LFATTTDSEHDAFNRIASYVAVLIVAVIWTLAIVLWRRAREATGDSRLRTVLGSSLVLAAAASLMMVRVTNIFWTYLPKLRFLQFPWRWLTVLAVVFLLFVGWTAARRWLVPLWIAFLLVAFITGAYLVRHTWWDAEDANFVKASIDDRTGFEGTDEYDPLGDDHTDVPQKQPEAIVISEEEIHPAPKSNVHILRWTAEDRMVWVKTEGKAAVRLRLLHYPAWQVTVNGKLAEARRTVSYDAILVPIAAGESRIEARLIRTRDRTVGGWISFASFLGLAGLAWPFRRSATKA